MFPGRSETIVKRNNLNNVNQAAARGINYRLVEHGFISNFTDATTFEKNIETIAKKYLEVFGITAKAKVGWIQNATGWWYRNEDGSYPAECLKKIDGDYYYFSDKK